VNPFFMRQILAGLTVSLILVISPSLASAEAGKCVPRSGVIKNFKPTKPPKSLANTPFLDAAGATRSLADYRGRGVVLNFWATWCPPCVREMPALDRLQVMLKGTGVEVVTLSEDRNGAALIEKFFALNGIKNLPKLIDPKGAALKSYGVTVLPTTIFINGNGVEIGRVLGISEWDSPEMVAFLSGCLGTFDAGDPVRKTFRTPERRRSVSSLG